MDDALARARFSAAPVAVLVTIAADGRPRPVPVTFVAVADRILTAVDDKPKTTRHLARLNDIVGDDRVSLLTQHYEARWSQLWWVRASGTAVVSHDAGAVAEAATLLAAKYEQYALQPPAGPVIEVVVTSWKGWEASPGN
jgi:PPOX class probable F420-dependent enzyme